MGEGLTHPPLCDTMDNQSKGGLINKEVPLNIQTRLTAAGGLNRYGEPNFRVVWGVSRLTWIGGEWSDTDNSGNYTRRIVEERQVPKYFPFERWYLEKWFPAEHYGSPEEWERTLTEIQDGKKIRMLGPYPSRGEYEMCYRLEKPDETYLALEPEIVEQIVRLIKLGDARSSAENRAAVWRAAEKAEKDWDNRADDILFDINQFDGKPHIYMPKAVDKSIVSGRELKAMRFIDMGAKGTQI